MHDHGSHSHPAAEVPASLLRLSAGERFAIAGALSLALWALVYWAVLA
jgi:hypothetical protein